MKSRNSTRIAAAGGIVFGLLVASTTPNVCLAGTLSRPAQRFIHFFSQSSAQPATWQQRFVYSLILTASGTPPKTAQKTLARK